MYVYYSKSDIIKAISHTPIHVKDCLEQELNIQYSPDVIGKNINPKKIKEIHQLKIAVICNWNQPCGISTYSQYLVNALTPKVKEVKIFSEGEYWERGQSMKKCINAVLNYNADLILIQHEFGLFPIATHFLTMMQMLEDSPYLVTMHSVYEHLDKTVCTSAIKNIVVHSKEGKNILRSVGNDSNINVVPHGCETMNDTSELWNIFQTPYCIVQFGFGFFYKGVDVAIETINKLKQTDEKYKNIFYCYLCSENPNNSNIHNEYYNYLMEKINNLDLNDNVAIIRKYQTDKSLSNYLRTAKMAIFPYLIDPNNTVYGASGAIRIAMAHGIPVVASKSHLFDDLQDVVPRCNSVLGFATQIDRIFSNHEYKEQLIKKQFEFVKNNTWDIVANKYLELYPTMVKSTQKQKHLFV
jgi:glycosyltransferase involved in cell wall biosynthesis